MYRKLKVLLLTIGVITISSLIIFLVISFVKAFQIEQELVKPTTSRNLPSYHFVLIGEELDNDYWRLVEKGAKEAEKYYDVFVEYNGPKRSNLKEHVKLIEMAIASKVDGIITQAISEKEFSPIINEAVRKGIPVITIDTDAPESERVAYIGTDNYYSGILAGRALIEDTIDEINVAIITGNFDSEHQKLRVQGFMDVIKDVERIKVIAIEESNISRLEAEQKAYQLLKKHEGINAFYGTSALDGIGIVAAMNKTTKDDLYIIAFDTLADTVEMLKNDEVQAIIAQEPFEMGFKSVELMMESLFYKPSSIVNHTNTSVIRKEDLKDVEQETHVIGDEYD